MSGGALQRTARRGVKISLKLHDVWYSGIFAGDLGTGSAIDFLATSNVDQNAWGETQTLFQHIWEMRLKLKEPALDTISQLLV